MSLRSHFTVSHTPTRSLLHLFTVKDVRPQTDSRIYYHKILCQIELHIFTIQRHCAANSFTSFLSEDTVPHTHRSSRPYHTYKFWSWFYTSFLQYRHESTRVSRPYEYILLVCSVFNPTNCKYNHKYLLFWDIPRTYNDPNRISAGR
jgi:hypothetical protein